jgi:peptide deformylase
MNNFLTLVPDNDPILKKKMPLFTGKHGMIKAWLPELFKFMKANHGIGLAAPQVGWEMNFFIMEINTTPYCVINPVIVDYSPFDCTFTEGCLSFPNVRKSIKRPEGIIVSYEDQFGEFITLSLKDIAARCFQHEFDHLNGITFDTL